MGVRNAFMLNDETRRVERKERRSHSMKWGYNGISALGKDRVIVDGGKPSDTSH